MVIMLLMTENRERQKFDRDYRANRRALRLLRSRAHLSLKALQDKAGVDYTTINRIERGHNRSPRWSTLYLLAEALGVEVDELVIYEDDVVPEEPATTRENERRIQQLRREQDERDRGCSTERGTDDSGTGDRTT